MQTTTPRPTRAATAVVTTDGAMVGFADRDVAGYTPTTYEFDTYDEAKACAAGINESLGLTVDEALDIVLSSHRAQAHR